MVIDNIFGFTSATRGSDPTVPNFLLRVMTTGYRQFGRVWCGMHGHLILLHFEPTKLSLQCAFCGYESEGWEVGRPLVARRMSDNASNRIHAHPHTVRAYPERRGLRAVPSTGIERISS